MKSEIPPLSYVKLNTGEIVRVIGYRSYSDTYLYEAQTSSSYTYKYIKDNGFEIFIPDNGEKLRVAAQERSAILHVFKELSDDPKV